MWKYVLFLVLSNTVLWVSSGFGDSMLGPGRWLVLNILQCENHDQYKIKFEISRAKLNRTHDSFSVHIKYDKEIDFSYGIEVIAYKEVDGGFKFYTKIADVCACTFIKKYTGDNLRRGLSLGKVDPPDCPIPAGELLVNGFVLDYRQFPEKGIYGTYDVSIYLLHLGEKVSCFRVVSKFDENTWGEDYDD